MSNEIINELEDNLREELMAIISNPDERAKAFTAMKKHNHYVIRAVLNDFRITLENKEQSILNSFPIE